MGALRWSGPAAARIRGRYDGGRPDGERFGATGGRGRVRPARRNLRVATLLLAASLLAGAAVAAAACRSGPEPIQLGLEECAYCRMVIEAPGHASQAVSTRGRAYKFDSVECLAAFTLSGELPADEVGSLWVADFGDPDRWLQAEEAVYLRSEELRSPMGLDLSAHGSREEAERHRAAFGGEILGWGEVRELVDRELLRGRRGPDDGPDGRDALGAPGGREIVVGSGEEVSTIAEALRMAADGDRILIRAGTYRERDLLVDRSVALVGEGWPVIDGQGGGTILRVRADSVEIRGLRLARSGASHVHDYAAIEVEEASDCAIVDNQLTENLFGVILARTRRCRVAGNRIEGSGGREAASGNGIHLWHSTEVWIEDNEVRAHRDGLYLEFSEATTVAGNRSSDNHRYGLHFMFSDGSQVRENDFRRNGAGVAIMYTHRVEMESNTFADNWGPASYGLLLKEITDSRVHGNSFRRNTVALYSEGSSRVEARRNRFEGNGWAVKVMSNSQENRFLENDFVENTFDVSTNSRRNPNTFRGNYWSGYGGYDLAGDGVGDVPHRPVRLFSLVVERNPIALILLRSPFVDLLDVAERVLPVLTPETLVDAQPRMREVTR